MLSFSSRDIFTDFSSCPDSYVMNSVTFQQPRPTRDITTIKANREERPEIKIRKSKRSSEGAKKGVKTTSEGGEEHVDDDGKKVVTRCPNHLWYGIYHIYCSLLSLFCRTFKFYNL